jgi:hypothetical protein
MATMNAATKVAQIATKPAQIRLRVPANWESLLH